MRSTDSSGTHTPHVIMGAGTVTTIVAGTQNTLGTVGNLNNGTITAGTVQTYGLRHADAFATVISQSGTSLGTVKTGIAGSAHYITDLSISAQTQCDVALYAGSTLLRGPGTVYLRDRGGYAPPIVTPIIFEAGSEITFRTIGTGLVSLSLRGYVD